MSDREHAAYRAAGQAVAALLHGAQLVEITIDGVDVAWSGEADCDRARSDILTDIAIGLGGVAAEDYFRFGRPPSECRSSLSFYCFNESQIADLAEVEKLVIQLDPDANADVAFQAFQQAFDLIAGPKVWPAVVRLASEVQRRDLSVREVASIFDGLEFRITSAQPESDDCGGGFDID